MDQVLTQQEIDALLNAMSTGEIDQEKIEEENDAAKVKSYDFRRPTKLSKEYVNTLHMIFEDFSKMGSNVLSTQMRANVRLQLAAIEQVSYDEFIHSIPRVTLLGLFHSEPLKGIQIIEMNQQLCMKMIEMLCGGADMATQDQKQGEESKEKSKDKTEKKPEENPEKNPAPTRKEKEPAEQEGKRKAHDKKGFTDIELAVLEEVVKGLTEVFQNSWKEIVELDTTLDGLDTNPQLLQNMSPNEPVVLSTFTINIGETSTFINLCIPYVFFEGITDKLSFGNWFDSSQKFDRNDERELRKGLNGVDMNIEVLLGESEMDLSDFLHLEVGDVVKLDSKIAEPLDSYIEGHPFYRVKPGKKNGQLAVELIDKLEGEQDE
ncbi:flagellar motor switch protein FliM [Liquorilactobacillus sucicola DSM 21376 = JCM 15457]|uniref:Flagellar motor switch protein FliM n=2 Tax=Liquorilactobacillus sucicola TaxID=519050 RepID=A0A023CWV1_9LACO|nr:FliM/FliN family flagellar motor switch protein [Liquorilactobacillus sucicola]AJA34353.1 flagellar motor switch protein FliM [Liquorilactobacillus sucicola]KRN06865.1 flagellar motor switch protein [Liquorilactobacillus sucicola DSM 21376 = JCM 15457]GAJ26342.1 flagellar motor switch protein FliM [Liquorilactobacillus sucicola DSM 21376 = JCM 15457]